MIYAKKMNNGVFLYFSGRYGEPTKIKISEQTKKRLFDLRDETGYPTTTLADALLNIAMDRIEFNDDKDDIAEWFNEHSC